MVTLLAEIVGIDSNSHDMAGVDRVGQPLRDWFEAARIACETAQMARQGDVLHAYVPGSAGNAPVLLMGHMDTVFPRDETSRRSFAVAVRAMQT